MNETKKDISDDLIIRYVFCETNPTEEQELKDWIASSEKNRRYFIKLRNTCFATMPLRTVRAISMRLGDNKTTKRRHSLRTIAAACSAIAAAAALVILLYVPQKNSAGRVALALSEIEFAVKNGTTASTVLPDGSRIWLNAGSRIVYDNSYGSDDRNVILEGEAYFEVVTNPQAPFVVKAKEIEVTAHGTSFNVSAYDEDVSVVTTLVDGAITITGKNINKPIKVEPNQTIEYFELSESHQGLNEMISKSVTASSARIVSVIEQTPAIKIESNPDALICWRENRWVVEGEKLETFVPKIERRYNVSVYFSGDEIKRYRLNGSFEGETIEEVLRIMKTALPLDYTIDKGNIILTADNTKLHSYTVYD